MRPLPCIRALRGLPPLPPCSLLMRVLRSPPVRPPPHPARRPSLSRSPTPCLQVLGPGGRCFGLTCAVALAALCVARAALSAVYGWRMVGGARRQGWWGTCTACRWGVPRHGRPCLLGCMRCFAACAACKVCVGAVGQGIACSRLPAAWRPRNPPPSPARAEPAAVPRACGHQLCPPQHRAHGQGRGGAGASRRGRGRRTLRGGSTSHGGGGGGSSRATGRTRGRSRRGRGSGSGSPPSLSAHPPTPPARVP